MSVDAGDLLAASAVWDGLCREGCERLAAPMRVAIDLASERRALARAIPVDSPRDVGARRYRGTGCR